MLETYFKVSDVRVRALPFGKHPEFNYVRFPDQDKENKAVLTKHMADSFKLITTGTVDELKITNQNMLTWEDYWVDKETGALADPRIKTLDLRKNSLVSVNINIDRPRLEVLNVDSNPTLHSLFLTSCPNLARLDMSHCNNLAVVNLGRNRNLQFLSVKGCNLNSVAQERLLRDFTPVITSDGGSNRLFRREYKTLLDLRGNDVDWANRRIASKIRLLLCNNWLVLWDTPPPTSVIPVQMYAFFTNNLEDSLIRAYYG